MARLVDLMTAHRKQVVGAYLAIRLLFLLASGLFLLFLGSGHLELPRGLSVAPDAKSQLWQPWILFFLWSLLLFSVGIVALRRGGFRAIDWAIWMSLAPDGYAVYLAASVAGGAASPFYHSAYFLIAIHSYHLVAPGSYSKRAVASRRRLLVRYVVFSVIPSVLVPMTIYLTLTGAGPRQIDLWVELGLQSMTASAFMLLGLTSLWRFRSLAQGETELGRARSDHDIAQSNLGIAQETLERTRVELASAQEQQKRLLKALAKVTNIAEMRTEENLRDGLYGLAEEIGRTLEAEYCAIGLVHESTAEDAAVWTCNKLTPEAARNLEAAKFAPLEESLVGHVVLHTKKTFVWDEDEHGDLLDPDNPVLRERAVPILRSSAEGYRAILSSGRIKHVLLTPFYTDQDEKPVGYVHLINHQQVVGEATPERFTEADRETLTAIAPQLAIAIENFRNQQRERDLREEEQVFESLSRNPDSNAVFNGLLAYINRAVSSRVASLWLPIEDGLGSPEEVRKLLLRAVHVRGEERRSGANQDLRNKLSLANFHSLAESYLARFLEGTEAPEIYYEPDLSGKPHCWRAFLDEIGTPRLLVVPITDSLPEAFAQTPTPPWKGVRAILCLRPIAESFTLTETVRQNLERFSRQLGELMLERRLKSRFEQINLLQHRLRELGVSDLSGFYQRLVQLVREVVGAEACSLFTTGRAPGKLALKASTADKAEVSCEGEVAHEVEVSSLIDQPIFSLDDDSLTSATYHHREAVLVHDTLGRRPGAPRFRESTKSSTRSFIAAPVVRSDGQPIGVLRCINQVHPGHMMPGFLPFDRDFLAFLTGIMARFIESAHFAEDKNRFLNELSHELATPLLQAQIHVSFLEKLWRGDRGTRDPMEQFGYLRESLQTVASLARDIQYQYGRTLSTLGSYDFSRQIDLHSSIEMIRKLFLNDARTQRASEIRGRTRGLPKLYVDKQRIEQVLFNLVQNAIKYSRWAGGAIRIEYSRSPRGFEGRLEGEWHRITISNNGIGVPSGEEEAIFSEYVRGSNVAMVGGGQSGTGLGLAVSRRIIENHGGRLTLLRREAPTVFAIYLPRYLEERAPNHETAVRG